MVVDNNDKKYAHLPLVPESVLRKRHDLDDLARKRAAAQALQTEKKQQLQGGNKGGGGSGGSKKKKAFYVKKPETIVARARSRRNNATRYRRVSKKGMQTRASNKKEYAEKEIDVDDDDDRDADIADDDDKEEETTTAAPAATLKYQKNSVGAKLVFVIRTRDHVGAPRVVRKTLDDLRLKQIHDGVFLRYSEQNRKLLHLVEPWIVYGPPTKAGVSDLIERRGFADVGGTRTPLSDNTVIEEALGDSCNVLCKEDLVHEISAAGDNFETAVNFLWPFRLADSKSYFERRTLKLKDGKDYGDRGEAIADYLQEVL